MFHGIVEVLLGILGLSIVVMVHEGGHYLAARLTGIRVETFSIGFGYRLLGFRRGGTDYRLSLIPLGGYCRFYGEQSFRQALDQKMGSIPKAEGEFYSASPWKRIIVSFAGPAANVVFSILALTLIMWIGFDEQYTEARIILASEWSDDGVSWPADEAKMETGDLITAVNGRFVDRFSELRKILAFRPGESLDVRVLRGGRELNLQIVPRLDSSSGMALIGVLNWVDPLVAATAPGSSAETAGFQAGDRILRVGSQPVFHTVGFYNALEQEGAGEVEVLRDGLTHILSLSGAADPGLFFEVMSGRSEKLNFPQAAIRGTGETWKTLTAVFRGLRMLFRGVEVQNAISGPLRLISDTGSVVAEGFQRGIGPGLLWSFEFMSLISVSLAFLNLLPIPVLDGGQILLFLLEGVKRRPVKPRSIYRYQVVGTVIVLLIAAAATMLDVLHFNNR